MTPTDSGSYAPGDRVHLRDPVDLAHVLFRQASGPADDDARLAMDLVNLGSYIPKCEVVYVEPDLRGQHLVIKANELNGGREFGVAASDVTKDVD